MRIPNMISYYFNISISTTCINMYQHVSTINMSFHLPMLSESHFDSKRGCSRGIRVRQSWPTQPLWDQHQGVCRPWQGVFLRCWPMACWASGVYDGVFMIHNGLLKILVLLLLFYINIYLCMCVCRCLPAMASLQEACIWGCPFHTSDLFKHSYSIIRPSGDILHNDMFLVVFVGLIGFAWGCHRASTKKRTCIFFHFLYLISDYLV